MEVKGYVQFILTRDLIRQWLTADTVIAEVQGADMLWSGLPSALALQVAQEWFGEKRVDELLTKMQRTYHKDRTAEPNTEQPLLYGDDIEYLEQNTGTMALYRLVREMRFAAFNSTVSSWLDSQKELLVFLDLYLALRESGVNDSLRNLFEKVERRPSL